MNTYNRYILLYSSLQLLGVGLILKVTEHERCKKSSKLINENNKKFIDGVFP